MIMQNQEVTQKMNNSEWMVTLERVRELKQLLSEVQDGTVLFWLDGKWDYRSGDENYHEGIPTSHLILSETDLRKINVNNVDNIILNIMKLLDWYKSYITYDPNGPNSFEQYLLIEKNSDISTLLHVKVKDNLNNSYNLNVYDGNIKIPFTFKWNNSGKNIKVAIDNSIYGYTNYHDLIMLLLEKTEEITEYKLYTQFFKDIRKFQNYYYQTVSEKNGEFYTSETEVRLLNPKFRLKYFDSKVNSYPVHYSDKVADIIEYFAIDVDVSDEKLLEKNIDPDVLYREFGYYDFFNNITVSNVKALVLSAMGITSHTKNVLLDTEINLVSK